MLIFQDFEKYIPAPLPVHIVKYLTARAIVELFLPRIVPGIIENPSIPLPNNIESVLNKLLLQLEEEEYLFLCCVKLEFNANIGIDPEWHLHHATLDDSIFGGTSTSTSTIRHHAENIVSRYNKYKQEGGQFLISDFERHFTNLIVRKSSRHVDQY
jgi:hypothetical protein